ncbi:hypothetical protein K6U06_23000 [Acidiferrimicrobium sp. IK]|uniref:hypothetical protein n=1 Tax=Acidiferrimicrobium sp. IK TaxID=2871700 RepID=UPI0021CB3E59|nr:hypothetical protein [Acidiferrimicrobium sp. IK]MCU4187249.1 hypothetical protein [Acidiferrimicrobium sp. IK]
MSQLGSAQWRFDRHLLRSWRIARDEEFSDAMLLSSDPLGERPCRGRVVGLK